MENQTHTVPMYDKIETHTHNEYYQKLIVGAFEQLVCSPSREVPCKRDVLGGWAQ